jgi:hypothetical protein
MKYVRRGETVTGMWCPMGRGGVIGGRGFATRGGGTWSDNSRSVRGCRCVTFRRVHASSTREMGKTRKE